MFRVVGDLKRDSFHQRAILLQSLAAFLKLGDGLIVFVLHLRDRVGGPEEVGQLVNLRPQRRPHFAENHASEHLSLKLGHERMATGIRRLARDLVIARKRRSVNLLRSR